MNSELYHFSHATLWLSSSSFVTIFVEPGVITPWRVVLDQWKISLLYFRYMFSGGLTRGKLDKAHTAGSCRLKRIDNGFYQCIVST